MNDTVKAGVRSTEFFVVLAFGVFAILSGLNIADGIVNYAMNQQMMDNLVYVVMTYIGGRSAIKAVETAKKPPPESELLTELKTIVETANKEKTP